MNDTKRFGIVATSDFVENFACFTWVGDPEQGIALAKAEAEEFGMFDLRNFRAVPLDDD